MFYKEQSTDTASPFTYDIHASSQDQNTQQIGHDGPHLTEGPKSALGSVATISKRLRKYAGQPPASAHHLSVHTAADDAPVLGCETKQICARAKAF